MMPILADAMTWTQVGVICTVLSGAVAIATYFSRSRVEVSAAPDAEFKVRYAARFAEKHELERIDGEVRELEQQRKKDVGALHEKINGVNFKVAGLETATQMQNQKLSSMDSKLDRLIERKS